MITCKKATYLLSKKEERKLSFLEKIQIKMHVTVCSLCRLFEQQTWLIGKNAPHTHEHSNIKLSEEAKQRIARLLENE
ncbi:hypothetical protein ACI6Q2_01635 [Chitinophagaceae bacterium LWZ2-11]